MDAYSWFRRNVSKLKKMSLPTAAVAVSTETGTSASSANSSKTSQNKLQEEEEKIYGITEQLIEFVKSFTLDTFRNFVLCDEEESGCDGGNSGNLNMDLSDWQETHAMLVLSRAKELAQLRFQLCPRYLKERQFWRIYFTLVRSSVSQYELHAVRLAKFKQIRSGSETVPNNGACEVEMSEAKLASSLESASSME
ncbi:BSD domain-containing protein [Perilla frutescens var. frutescens]|nr:BSD domain-containing protein [Perilla frutescens var. frutescens]